MASLTSLERLDIAEIVIYSTLLIPTIWICYRHGKPGLMAWQIVASVCIMRIGAASMLLSRRNNPIKLNAAVILFESGSITTLLLAPIGIIFEASYYIPACSRKVNKFILALLHLATIAFITLGSFGNGMAMKSGTVKDPKELTGYFGLVFLTVVVFFHALVVLFLRVTTLRDVQLAKKIRFMLYGCTTALPFVGIRFAHNISSAFIRDPNSNPVTGAFVYVFTTVFLTQLIATLALFIGGWLSMDIKTVATSVVEGPERFMTVAYEAAPLKTDGNFGEDLGRERGVRQIEI